MDGNIRIFRNYERQDDVELVSAFRGLCEIVPTTNQEAGTVAEWQQTRGQLLVSGNARIIRVWDAPREFAVQVRLLHFLSFLWSVTGCGGCVC